MSDRNLNYSSLLRAFLYNICRNEELSKNALRLLFFFIAHGALEKTITFSKKDIAQTLCTIAETVKRLIDTLCFYGLLKHNNKKKLYKIDIDSIIPVIDIPLFDNDIEATEDYEKLKIFLTHAFLDADMGRAAYAILAYYCALGQFEKKVDLPPVMEMCKFFSIGYQSINTAKNNLIAKKYIDISSVCDVNGRSQILQLKKNKTI